MTDQSRDPRDELLAERDALAARVAQLEGELAGLRAQDALVRALFDSGEISVWAIDAGARTVFVNAALAAMFGYSEQEMIGRHLFDFMDEEGRRMAEWNLARREQGIREDHAFRFLRADGTPLWTLLVTAPLGTGADYQGAVALVIDVGDQRAKAAAYQESAALMRAAIEQTPAGVLIADAPDNTLRMANAQALDMGIPLGPAEPLEEDLRPRRPVRWDVRWPDGTPCDINELPLARAVNKGEVTVGEELIIRDREGRDRWILANSSPVRTSDGEIAGGVVVFADITERKLAERERDQLREKMLQAQRLESLGVLAGGIAHDFNNILAAVLGESQLALEKLPEGHRAREHVEKVVTSGRVAAALTRQILSYAGKAPLDARPLDLAGLIRELTPLIQASVPRKVRVGVATDAGLPPVRGDRAQLQQLILNLMVNAAEAIEERSGHIELQAYEGHLAEEDLETLHPNTPAAAGDYVILEVQDDGRGMDAETLDRLFDPFFSTKGQGRGLGMAAALGIVRGHHAGLQVASAPARGARFRIYLPSAGEPPAPAPAPEAPIPEVRAGTTVLVVDDEAPVRGVFRAILSHYGYTVLEAAGGQEAAELYRRRGREIDLVLLDITMPPPDGIETLRNLRAMDPGVRVILCSGYSRVEVMARSGEGERLAFVQKPVSPRGLVEAVRRALESPAPG